jgi:hypothetical protein
MPSEFLRNQHWRAFASVLLASVILICASPAQANDAATILVNGRVHAGSGIVEALAVDSRGVILATGSTAEVEKMSGPGTRRFELQGRTVLPGFHDQHVHPLFAGLSQRQCVIPQGATLEQLQKNLTECATRTAKGQWIFGGQWDASTLAVTLHRSQLDAVTPDHPVLIYDTSGHSAWANSLALRLAKLTNKTRNPTGGIIERDNKGAPTGVLRESAVELVNRIVPPPTDAQVRESLSWALNEMLAHGITSFTEASLGFPAGPQKELDAYVALADAGALKQRVRLCMTWVPRFDSGSAIAEEVIANRNRYARDRLSLDCVKIFLDGVPTDSHTAAMLEPYAGTIPGRNDDASRFGMVMVPKQVLNEAVARFDRLGLGVKFHAAGDAAVRAGLDAIEFARRENGYSTRLHDVGHCTFVSKSDLPRARAIGATFEVSPYLFAPSPINDDITKAIGPERIARVWPVRDMLESGALVVAGSDWAVVPSVNPWIAVETLATRENVGGSEKSFGKGQAITVEQALRLFTENAARHNGTGARLGRLERGMIADVIVVDQDPLSAPVTALHKTRVMQTFIGGELVYQRPEN